MKLTKYIFVTLALGCGMFLPSCEEFEAANENPNNPETVSSNYILTYVLTGTATTVYRLGAEGSNIAGAMQYIQRGTNEGASDANYYQWEPESWTPYYDVLRNTKIIYDNAAKEENNFFKGIALVMRAYVFGLLTDLYGDVPYSEALQANDGTFFPKYDRQQDVYKGILEDLREANVLLSSLDADDRVDAASDILYKGDAVKWRKFANSLRLRYALRLSPKRTEMSAAGIDIVQEFKDAAPGAFTDNGDNAVLPFLGITPESSTVGGPLNSTNPFYSAKPG
ncbi:MAG TPA: SusD/RagB family nutrient-binding outer membrane lipoprotein, partial [Anseongella sp.]|nr:SusD/RagB family nutrient-binding outer membrane lipoprotein [Anseongella sp.]